MTTQQCRDRLKLFRYTVRQTVDIWINKQSMDHLKRNLGTLLDYDKAEQIWIHSTVIITVV